MCRRLKSSEISNFLQILRETSNFFHKTVAKSVQNDHVEKKVKSSVFVIWTPQGFRNEKHMGSDLGRCRFFPGCHGPPAGLSGVEMVFWVTRHTPVELNDIPQ